MSASLLPPNDGPAPADYERDMAILAGMSKPNPLKLSANGRNGHTAGEPIDYELRTTDEIAARPASKYRIKGLLLAEGIACVFGASGSGKSFLAMDMGIAISDGLEWFGKRVNPCDVTWICLEGLGGLERRVKAIKSKYGEQAGARMRFIVQPFNLTDESDVDRLIAAIEREEMDHGVIVLDTLNASTPGMDENSSKDMGFAIAAAKRIQAACGGLVILIHHSGKNAAMGLRGHSSLHGALDTLIEVIREPDRREWKLIKSKDGADGEAHPFSLEVIELGIDEDGDSITSCAIGNHSDSQTFTASRPKLPKGNNQRIAYDCIGPLFKSSPHFGMEGSPYGRPCITIEAAIETIRSYLTCASDQRTRSATTAITGLVSAGCLMHKNGWLWLL